MTLKRLAAALSLGAAITLSACGGGGGSTAVGGGVGEGEETVQLFGPQAFSDDFDAGTTDARWGCTIPGVSGSSCRWEVVSAGPLGPAAESTPASADQNLVFQSPDPKVQDPNRGGSCERFSAKFEQEGTFAFNYFVKTAGPAGGILDGNYLEVNVWSNTLEFDPAFDEEIIVDRKLAKTEKWSGNASDRYQTILPPGNYDFEFCYLRNQTVQIGSEDFVQIDNVDTCVGTSCMGERPTVARCQVDQGETLTQDSNVARTILTVTRVQGTDDRYYVIIDAEVLDLVSGGLASNPQWDTFRQEVDGVREVLVTNGASCDVDQRKYLLLEMSQGEIIDFIVDTESFQIWMNAILELIQDGTTNALQEIVGGEVVGIIMDVVEQGAKAIARFLAWIVAKIVAGFVA